MQNNLSILTYPYGTRAPISSCQVALQNHCFHEVAGKFQVASIAKVTKVGEIVTGADLTNDQRHVYPVPSGSNAQNWWSMHVSCPSGANDLGQLGTGDTEPRSTPSKIGP